MKLAFAFFHRRPQHLEIANPHDSHIPTAPTVFIPHKKGAFLMGRNEGHF